jgi:AraC family transcriptional regulator
MARRLSAESGVDTSRVRIVSRRLPVETRARRSAIRQEDLTMLIRVERPAFTVIGLHIRTRPLSPEIPEIWPKFVARMGEIPAQAEPGVAYGVMWHEPGSMDVLHYMAAVSVTTPERIPAGMRSFTIPASEWAVFSFPLSRLGEGFCEIFDRLLPASDHEQAPGPYFERYDESFCPDRPDSAVAIHVPVRRRMRQAT